MSWRVRNHQFYVERFALSVCIVVIKYMPGIWMPGKSA